MNDGTYHPEENHNSHPEESKNIRPEIPPQFMDYLQQTPPPPKKKKLSKILILSIGGGVLLLALLIGLIIYTRPSVMLKHGVEDALDDLTDAKLVSALLEAAEDGSVSVSIGETAAIQLGSPSLANTSLTVWMNSKKQEAILSGNVNGSEVGLWLTEEALAAKLDGETFGTEHKNLFRDFEDSVFAPDSGTDYALELNADQMAALERLCELLNDKKFKRYMEDAGSEYRELILDAAMARAEFEKEGDGANSTVTLSLDEDDMAAILEILAEALEDDDQLRDLYICSFTLSSETSTDEQALSFWQSLIESLEKSADSVRGTRFTLRLSVTVNRFTHSAKSIDLRIKSNYATVLKLAYIPEESISLSYDDPESEGGLTLEGTLGNSEFRYVLETYTNRDRQIYEFLWDRPDETVTLTQSYQLLVEGSPLIFESALMGTVEFFSDDRAVLEFHTCKQHSDEEEPFNLVIELNGDAKEPKLPDYHRLSDLTISEVDALWMQVVNAGLTRHKAIPAGIYTGYLSPHGTVALRIDDSSLAYSTVHGDVTYSFDGTTMQLYQGSSLLATLEVQVRYNSAHEPYLIVNGNPFYLQK